MERLFRMLIAGVDDAGRGPIIGPLVVAGLTIEEGRMGALLSLGVKDSKLLSPSARDRLAERVKMIAERYTYVELTPAEIDEVVHKARKLRRLNYLEARAMGRVIAELKPDVAYVDASDVLAERFKEQVAEGIPFEVRIVSEHHADRKYPIVSAASILAKTRRDEAVGRLRQQYGDFGSGYVTDSKTIEFLKKWLRDHDTPPPFVRRSWKTLKVLKEKCFQTELLG